MPDWAAEVPSAPVHNLPVQAGGSVLPFTPEQLLQLGAELIEQFLKKVLLAIVGSFIPGISSFDQLREWALALPGIGTLIQMIEDLTGVNLFTIFDGIDITNPGAVLGVINSAAQAVINAIVAALTGGASSGSNPLEILFGLLNQAAQVPGSLLALLFGQSATNQAQINAVSSSGFIHDFASHGVTGWTNLVGTLAISSRGPFVQASTVTVATRPSGVASDKYGAHFVAIPSMQGASRVDICSNTTGTDGTGLQVYRGFDGDALRLVTAASPTLTVVHRQADFIGENRLGQQVSLDVKTDGVSKFWVLRDGQPVTALDWTDSGGLATHDASHRNVLLASNEFDTNEDSYYGPATTKVLSYAW